MIKVEALDKYREYGIVDTELNFVPDKGFQWEVTEERAKILLGENDFKMKLVKKIGDDNNAIKKGKKSKDNKSEHKNGNESGKITETSK